MILCSRLCAEVWSELSPHPTGVQTRSQIWSRTRLESLELSASFSIRSSFLLNQHTAIRLSSLFSSQICNEMMILDQEDCGHLDTWVFLQEMCCGSLWRRRSTYRLGGSERWNSWRMGTCCSFAGANADFTNPQLLLEALLLPCVKTSLFLFVSRSVSPSHSSKVLQSPFSDVFHKRFSLFLLIVHMTHIVHLVPYWFLTQHGRCIFYNLSKPTFLGGDAAPWAHPASRLDIPLGP